MGCPIAIINAVRPGFSRLKGVFRKGINLNQYDEIVSTAKNTVIGNLPKDLLNLVIKTYNPAERGAVIKSLQAAFDDTALNLSKIEKVEELAIKRIKPSSDKVAKLFNCKPDDALFADEVFERDLAKITMEAEKKLFEKMSPFFKDLSSVKINHLGAGSYGNAFKCEILSTSGEKLINDKVIKTFREYDFTKDYICSLSNVLSKFSVKNIARILKKSGTDVDKKDIEIYKKTISMVSKAVGNQEAGLMARRMHGAAAEANIAEYLRFFAGHNVKASDGLVIPSLFKLGEYPYQISEFISKPAEAARARLNRVFDFSRLGLKHTDLAMNQRNLIDGICVDIGGIVPAPLRKRKSNSFNSFFELHSSNIVGDKFMTKLLKHFKNCKNEEERINFIKNLEEQAKKTKDCINRDKIYATIDEIKNKFLDIEI